MDNPQVDEPRETPPDWALSQGMAPPGAPDGMSGPKITPNQRGYLLSLISKKKVKPEQEGKLSLVIKCLRISEDPEEYGMSKTKASELIDWFLKQPDLEKPQTILDDDPLDYCQRNGIRAGRYAVENAEGILRFYTVDIPEKGPWLGWVFINVWASDDKYPIKGKEAKMDILNRIRMAGPVAAMQRFGQEIGACAICGRTLTDELSRSIGIGPVCRDNL